VGIANHANATRTTKKEFVPKGCCLGSVRKLICVEGIYGLTKYQGVYRLKALEEVQPQIGQ
jgi:hypothetical protein